MAYMWDIKQFMEFAVNEERVKALMDIELPHVERFLGHLYDRGLARNSQARMLSGVRSFCKYLRHRRHHGHRSHPVDRGSAS